MTTLGSFRLVVHDEQQDGSSHMPMCMYAGAVRLGPWASMRTGDACPAMQGGATQGDAVCLLGVLLGS